MGKHDGNPMVLVTFRVKPATYEAYCRASAAMGLDRSTMFRQVIEAGVPAMRAAYETLEAVKAGQPLQGLTKWRQLIGQAVRMSHTMAVEAVELESQLNGPLPVVEDVEDEEQPSKKEATG
jgi:hypothetical protein